MARIPAKSEHAFSVESGGEAVRAAESSGISAFGVTAERRE